MYKSSFCCESKLSDTSGNKKQGGFLKSSFYLFGLHHLRMLHHSFSITGLFSENQSFWVGTWSLRPQRAGLHFSCRNIASFGIIGCKRTGQSEWDVTYSELIQSIQPPFSAIRTPPCRSQTTVIGPCWSTFLWQCQWWGCMWRNHYCTWDLDWVTPPP